VSKIFSLTKPQTLAFISFFLFFSWIFLVLTKGPDYRILVRTDPLAMINVLFPYFWVILAALITVCLIVFIKRGSPLWLHVLLLVQLSLMLYYTPFLLGGFSWSPDSLWHGGIASYMPAILSGSKFSLTEYGHSYPVSFLVTYGVERLFSIDIFTYTLYIFPPICTALISGLAYFFTSRILDKRTAFLSMLFALPTLHYIETHVSPFATGTVLLLASLVLLTYKSAKAFAFSLLIILAATLTHPISPIFLGIYLICVLIVNFLFGKKSVMLHSFWVSLKCFFKRKDLRTYSINSRIFIVPLMFLFLVDFWLYWTIYVASPNYMGVDVPVSKVLDLSFLSNLINTVEWTTGGQGFIYPSISQLSLSIYAIFLVSIATIFLVNFFKFLKNRKNVERSVPLRLTLTLTAIGSGVMSYLLFSSSGERFLLGRGLIFFLLMGSICIATYISANNIKRPKIKIAVAFAFVLFLVFTFPVISYSKEAYNTFTPSADAGLKFLTNKIDLSNKTLSMTSDQQLASYADLTKGLNLIGFPPDLSYQQPDVVVLRINSYYLMAMRYDLSFNNNSYTNLRYNLTEEQLYNHIYSNINFEVFLRIGG
jgi:hypothetical protein